MDKLSQYKEIIENALQIRAKRKPANLPHVERQLIIDPLRNHFMLATVGWKGEEFIHNLLVHLQLKNGKVWILCDRTDPGYYEILQEAGIPKKDIVLGYVLDYEAVNLSEEVMA